MDTAVGRTPDHPLSLPEELLLIALVPSGRVPQRSHVRLGVTGAVLAELEWRDAVRVDGKRLEPSGRASTTGDPQLDDAVAALRAGDRPRIRGWLRRTSRGRPDGAYLARLDDAGVVRGRRVRALGIFPVTLYQVREKGLLRDVRAGLDAAARGRRGADARAVRLAALAGAVRLERRLYRGREHREERKRLRRLAGEDPVAQAVLREVRSREAAATSAATSGG